MAIVVGAGGPVLMNDPFDFSGLSGSVGTGIPTATNFATLNLSVGGLWQFQGVGFGNFVGGIATVGTITEFSFTRLSSRVVTFSGLSLPMNTLLTLANQNNLPALLNIMFGGDDTITGSAQDDFLYGYGGTNALSGGDGNDNLSSIETIDVLDGGAGVDHAGVNRGSSASAYSINVNAAGTASGITLPDGTVIRNVERISITTGSGADTYTASGLIGNNAFWAGIGQDQLILDLSATTAPIFTGSGNFGSERELSSASFLLTYNSVERLQIIAGSGNDGLDGGTGDDIIGGGPGDDLLFGGSGSDDIGGGEGDDRIRGDDGDDVLQGGDGADNLDGGAGVDIATGGAGGDTINGGLGVDTMTGGAGDDFYVVDDAFDLTIEIVGEGSDTVESSVTWFQPDNVENLTLTSGNAITGGGNALANVITGNGMGSQLFGFEGNDTLIGGGSDQLFGGPGDDIYVVSTGTIVFEAQPSWGIDVVRTLGTFSLGANIENLVLVVGAGAINGTGNGLANRITGNFAANALFGLAGDDVLNGGVGADQMFGGLGDDLYVVDDAADFTFEAQSAWGTDTVQTSADYQLGQNIDNLVLQAGAGALTGRGNLLGNVLTGNESANTLFGFAGNDTLDGGAGADQLYGREGDDAYIVDSVSDVVSEANSAWGTDTIFASVTYFLSPNIEHLTLTGAANINGNGNGLNNTLTGNSGANNLFGLAGNDTLDGGAGADALFGGEGDDLYIVDNAGDVGFEASTAWGIDLVQASVNHVLGTNLDNLTLTGASAINGTGNGLANTLTGNGAANQLFGLGGADTLNGGAGNDALDGGGGDDAFLFAPGSGSDTITGFIAGGAEDSINLSAYNGSGVTWTMSQVGADTIFVFSNGDQIALTGVTASALVQTDPFGYG